MKCKICDRFFENKGIIRHLHKMHKVSNVKNFIEYFSIKEINIYFKRIYDDIKIFDKELLELCKKYNFNKIYHNNMITYLKNNIKNNNINIETINRLEKYLLYNKKISTACKEHYEIMYGLDLGNKLYDKYIKVQARAGIKLEWFIETYGLEDGTTRYNNAKEKSKISILKIEDKNTSKGSKHYWIKRGYTEEESKTLALKNNSYSKEYLRNKGFSEIEINNKIKKQHWQFDEFWENKEKDLRKDIKKAISDSNKKSEYHQYIKKFGMKQYLINKFGEEYYIEYLKKIKSFLDKTYSNISYEFFNNFIKLDFFENKNDCYFYNHGGEKSIGRYYVDFYYKGVIIEFYGDIWHGNPKIFDEYEINPITKKAYFLIIENDAERINSINKIMSEITNFKYYDVIIVWESEYRNIRNDKIKLINYLDCIKLEILELMNEFK